MAPGGPAAAVIDVVRDAIDQERGTLAADPSPGAARSGAAIREAASLRRRAHVTGTTKKVALEGAQKGRLITPALAEQLGDSTPSEAQTAGV